MPFDVLPRRQDFYGSQLFGSSFIFEPPPLCCSAVAAAAARIDGSTGSDSNPTMPLRCTPRFPNCNLYNRDGLQASPPGLLMTTLSVYRQLRIPSFRYKISTTEREEKRHALPKRHQIKHLEFVVS
jgi:hypothetical protein